MQGAAGAASAPAVAAVAAMPILAGRPVMYAFSDSDRGSNITLSDANTVATTGDKWATVLVAHAGITPASSPGKYLFAVRVLAADSGAGIAVGVADMERFSPSDHNLGAHRGSWAYSKTGKVSDGGEAGWTEFGEPYGVGDTITVEVDPRAGRLRFWRNGQCQGTAFSEELTGVMLVPALCLGSNGGGRTVKVQLVNPEVREFDRAKAHHRVQFSDDATTVFNSGKWASALAAHAGVRNGRLSWSVRLDDVRHGAGVAVGVVDAERFDWEKQNLGASPHSWCFSKTGKKGDGAGFQEYGKQFANGDVITITLDMDAPSLSFAINGEDQGLAYDASAGFGACALVPAVCIGSTEGGRLARVSILGPPTFARRFDRAFASSKIKLAANAAVAETSDKWGTAFLEHPGVSAGRFSFAVAVTSAGQGCGAGIGFADMALFRPAARNLGAGEHSWCYSKTGKKSAGTGGFEAYAAPFKTGDVVTAELDMEEESVRFYVNGHDQGVAFRGGLAGRTLVPAVVLGSSDGGHFTQLTAVPPAITRFDPRRANKGVRIAAGDRAASTDGRWCSVLADHPGAAAPGELLRFAVRLEGDGGAAVGVADASLFRPYAQNLGASPGTWALSKTGKISCGEADGFKPFTEKLSAGEVVGVELDLRRDSGAGGTGTLRFWRNGLLLGQAFGNMSAEPAGPGEQWSTAIPWTRRTPLVPAVCLGSK
jgi:hypothetical protein